MSFTLIWVSLIVAVVDWVAVATQRKWLEYIAKPSAMLVLLVWLYQVSGFKGPLVWFALGVVFSLAGDIFLMLPREQFIAGLIAFLLAHICYIIGFLQTPVALNLPGLIVAVIVALVFLRIYRRIAAGLDASGNSALKIPVLLYSLVISVMLFLALRTMTDGLWLTEPALLVSAGALLFFLSDTLLAWNKFVQPLRQGRFISIIPYHLGQIMLSVGALLHYMPPV
jgi:alkenylglycerophosphocholine/alkenylglycerophosphoethanolamine hydrolase